MNWHFMTTKMGNSLLVGTALVLLLLALGSCKGEVMTLIEGKDGACSSDITGNDRGEGQLRDEVSALGDGGMRDARVRVGLESWNFCNRVGSEGPGNGMPSPRQADCTDMQCPPAQQAGGPCQVERLVKVADNELKSGHAFPQGSFIDSADPDDYAVQKELYLASLCEVISLASPPWHFWMIMLKNGNFDVDSGLCPSTAPPTKPTRSFTRHQQPQLSTATTKAKGSFPCFGPGCMNHPMIYHNWSTMQAPSCVNTSNGACNEYETSMATLSGSFYGTYDLEENSPLQQTIGPNKSYFSVDWTKDPKSGSWLFHHILRVNHNYPWLMLYLRADATQGLSGGYPWETRGMMVKVPESPNFKVTLTLNVVKGGGSASQFYLLDIGGCWKNDGTECDGNTTTDVTRYSEMIINPSIDNWCRATDLSLCPPYHVDAKSRHRIYRNDTAHFPYEAYHLYCVPPNAQFAEPPFRVCDPYSNPQPQELMQLLPHPEWAIHGYPSTKGQGWVGDPTTWTLDVGGLSQRLYFYQDPNTPPAPRKWPSIDVGTEIYISEQTEIAEWIVSDFDVLIAKSDSN